MHHQGAVYPELSSSGWVHFNSQVFLLCPCESDVEDGILSPAFPLLQQEVWRNPRKAKPQPSRDWARFWRFTRWWDEVPHCAACAGIVLKGTMGRNVAGRRILQTYTLPAGENYCEARCLLLLWTVDWPGCASHAGHLCLLCGNFISDWVVSWETGKPTSSLLALSMADCSTSSCQDRSSCRVFCIHQPIRVNLEYLEFKWQPRKGFSCCYVNFFFLNLCVRELERWWAEYGMFVQSKRCF